MGDFFACLLYPNAILQMDVETRDMAEVENERLTQAKAASQKLSKRVLKRQQQNETCLMSFSSRPSASCLAPVRLHEC